MITAIAIVYLIGIGIYSGCSLAFAVIITMFTLGSEEGTQLAGKILLTGMLTSPFWFVVIPYRMIKGKFGR